MKKLLFLLLIPAVCFHLQAQNTPEDAANAYAGKEYSKAAEIYEQLLKTNGESAEIYYNIGNCYAKLNKTASAILNYERALLLAPGDPDIRYNLEYTYSKTVDKIESVGDFFLVDWWHAIQNLLTTNQWSRFAITCFLLFIGCLFLFFFSRKIFLKKLGAYFGMGLLALIIVANSFAYNQKKKLTHRNSAIVFAATVTIKSSPDNSGTDLFVLHEGTKVIIKSKLGNWNEIEIADGNVGWIKSEDIVVI